MLQHRRMHCIHFHRVLPLPNLAQLPVRFDAVVFSPSAPPYCSGCSLEGAFCYPMYADRHADRHSANDVRHLLHHIARTGKACCFAKALGHSSYKMLNCTSGTTVAPPPPRPPPPPPPSPPPPLPPHLPDGGGSCRTEADCYYGGICSAAGSVCRCDPTWTGAHCSVLHLLPARAGSGYPTNPFNPGDSLPTTKTFTWGGAVVKDYTQSDGSSSSKNTNGDTSAIAARASEGGLYHGFFAQFVNNCPMTYPTWTSSTHIRHATSPNPDGPWTDAGVAVPQAAGNPVVTRAS